MPYAIGRFSALRAKFAFLPPTDFRFVASHENQQCSIEADDDGHNKYSRSLILRYY